LVEYSRSAIEDRGAALVSVRGIVLDGPPVRPREFLPQPFLPRRDALFELLEPVAVHPAVRRQHALQLPVARSLEWPDVDAIDALSD
jgi:hypothetical protein